MKKVFFIIIIAFLAIFALYGQTVVTQFKPGVSVHVLGGLSVEGPMAYAGASYVNNSNVLFSLQGKVEYLDADHTAQNVAFTVGYVHGNQRRADYCYPRKFKPYLIPTISIGYGKFIETVNIETIIQGQSEADVIYNAPYANLGYCVGLNAKKFQVGVSADISILYRTAQAPNYNYEGIHSLLGFGVQGGYKLNEQFTLQALASYHYAGTLGNYHGFSGTIGVSYIFK